MSRPQTPISTALRYAVLYWIEFLKVLPTRRGLFGREGRILIWGKIRRVLLCLVPSVARSLHNKHDIKGGCAQCGTSCRLLFTCPALDVKTNNCRVYDRRPNVCRLFPITPVDILDRNIVAEHVSCGYIFPSLSQSKSIDASDDKSKSHHQHFDLAS